MAPSALVTGVSRQAGIGWAVAAHLAGSGWAVDATGRPAHDRAQPWGADAVEPDLEGVRWTDADLADPAVPDWLVADHVARHGGIDALVAVHARSSSGGLGQLTPAELDACFAVNSRATLLLVQAAAAAGVRRVVLFTTGVHREPMPGELAYAASKAAIAGVTASLAAALAPAATVNCVNPGPVDTGWADPATAEAVADRAPSGRWGQPADIVPVVDWLLSDGAGWVTGQVLDADGGWAARAGR